MAIGYIVQSNTKNALTEEAAGAFFCMRKDC